MVHPRGRLRVVAFAAALLGLGAVAACSPDPGPAAVTGPLTIDRPATQPQPYDIFLGDKLGLVDYAVLELRDRCLSRAGYDETVRQGSGRRPRDTWGVLLVSRGTLGLASEEVARRSGFGHDAPAEPAPLVSSDASFDHEVERCEAAAWNRLAPRAQERYHSYNDLGNKLLSALAAVRTAPWPAGLAVKMADCMTNQGFPPNDRSAWLTRHVIQGFGVPFGHLEEQTGPQWTPKRIPGTVEVGPPIAGRRYMPTEGETRLAVAWYRCDTANGLTAGLYDRAMAAERTTVDEHEAEFTELNPELEQLARDAVALVGA